MQHWWTRFNESSLSHLLCCFLFPQVNAISFHPVHGTLATVGSDGRFSFWDKDARTKLKTSEQLDQPITACCFNHNGNIFAYASSYDWSKVGGFEHVCLRSCLSSCCMFLSHSSCLNLTSSGPWVLQPPEKELHLPEKCCWGAETTKQEMVREGQLPSADVEAAFSRWGCPTSSVYLWLSVESLKAPTDPDTYGCEQWG